MGGKAGGERTCILKCLYCKFMSRQYPDNHSSEFVGYSRWIYAKCRQERNWANVCLCVTWHSNKDITLPSIFCLIFFSCSCKIDILHISLKLKKDDDNSSCTFEILLHTLTPFNEELSHAWCSHFTLLYFVFHGTIFTIIILNTICCTFACIEAQGYHNSHET